MWQILAHSAGNLISASFWGAAFGFALTVAGFFLLPSYMRLWNKSYVVRLWQYVVLGIVSLVTIGGFGAWGAVKGIETSGLQMGASVMAVLQQDHTWVQDARRQLSGRRAAGETAATAYVRKAIDIIRGQNPQLAGLLEASSTQLENYVAEIHVDEAAMAGAVTQHIWRYWEDTVRGWAGRVRMIVATVVGGTAVLFLSLLGWLALRDIRL